MDFTGYTIFDIYGVERVPLVGALDAQGLAHKLIEEWIPYLECEKCGRGDYCKYVKRDGYRSDHLADIQCGVIVEVIIHFVQHTFPLLEKMTPEQVQAYLDGAFHLEQFLYYAEQTTGMFIDDDILRFYGDYTPTLFGRVTNLREHLNKAASEFRVLPAFASNSGVLFVEGWAEKAILNKLRESHFAWFLNLAVEVYEGRSNRRLKRIQMLLDRCVKQGYIIYIQGDADGGNMEPFRALCDKGIITPDHVFTFHHDFETAIPHRILYQALKNLGEGEKIDYVDFEKVVTSEDMSVVKLLSDKCSIQLESLKVRLAEAVGDILNDPYCAWWQDDVFMESELGKFLKFTMHI